MMNKAEQRRKNVLAKIISCQGVVSASALAKELAVSRQVIVGDVALLRAEGHDIVATARGYRLSDSLNRDRHIRKIACRHLPEDTKNELYLLVDHGVYIQDVIIEHQVYGEMIGTLGLESRSDVDDFLARLEKSQVKLLSELTQGIHLHTICCRSQEHFEMVVQKLEAAGYLV